MNTEDVKKIIIEETRKIIKEVFTNPLYGGGYTTGNFFGYYDFGYEGFNTNTLGLEDRKEIAKRKFEELLKQYGNEEDALKAMPEHMLIYM